MAVNGSGELFRLKARPVLITLFAFVILLGVINSLLVNQRVILNLFFIPVIIAAWRLPRKHASEVAILAGLTVAAYAIMTPEQTLTGPTNKIMVWADMGIWAGILVLTAYTIAVLRERSANAFLELQRAYGGVLSILTKFIQTVDVDTEAHSVRVSLLAVRIAQQMGLRRTETEEIRVAALLHDVGKVAVSVDILRKASALSPEDRKQIEQHTSAGADLVKPVGGMLSEIADGIESHHEKYDGSGYNGLAGDDIPLIGRIVGVADAFDAIVSDRPYSKAVDPTEAVDIIKDASGSHFDPRVVRALIRVINQFGDEVFSSELEIDDYAHA